MGPGRGLHSTFLCLMVYYVELVSCRRQFAGDRAARMLRGSILGEMRRSMKLGRMEVEAGYSARPWLCWAASDICRLRGPIACQLHPSYAKRQIPTRRRKRTPRPCLQRAPLKKRSWIVIALDVTIKRPRRRILNSTWLTSAAPAHTPRFGEVIRKLRTGAMPPQGLPRPDAAAVDGLSTYLETSLDRAATLA